MDDIVTARADYSRLDQSGSPIRIRLNSTVVHVNHVGPAEEAKEVEIAYMRGDKLQNVRAQNCVLACYNGMIPYLCPDLPSKQREALSYLEKAALIYTHVAISKWTSFHKLGIHQMKRAGYISEHDALIGEKLARILTGGDLNHETQVSEQYLLDLEREAFLSLVGMPKTQDRIANMLKMGKPLRN